MKKYRYECDGGSLAVLVNGVKVQIGNGYGDGSFSVFVLDEKGDCLGSDFEFTGTSVCGPATLEILDYDCTGGNPVGKVELKNDESAFFYRDTGDVAIEIFRRK